MICLEQPPLTTVKQVYPMSNNLIENVKHQLDSLLQTYTDGNRDPLSTINEAIEGVTESLSYIASIVETHGDCTDEQVSAMFSSIKDNISSASDSVTVLVHEQEVTKREILKLLAKLVDLDTENQEE